MLLHTGLLIIFILDSELWRIEHTNREIYLLNSDFYKELQR